MILNGINGAPGKTRTCGLLIRSQTLYPTELRAHPFRCSNLQQQTEFRNRQIIPSVSHFVPNSAFLSRFHNRKNCFGSRFRAEFSVISFCRSNRIVTENGLDEMHRYPHLRNLDPKCRPEIAYPQPWISRCMLFPTATFGHREISEILDLDPDYKGTGIDRAKNLFNTAKTWIKRTEMSTLWVNTSWILDTIIDKHKSMQSNNSGKGSR